MTVLPESKDNVALACDASYGLVASGSQNFMSIVDSRNSSKLVTKKQMFHAGLGTEYSYRRLT